jgi:hypothetical protein
MGIVFDLLELVYSSLGVSSRGAGSGVVFGGLEWSKHNPQTQITVRAERTTARFHFEARGDSTIVRLVQTGWKSGEEWDKAYEYLLVGNAQLLSTLHRRFVTGPIDWEKEWGVKPGK